LGTLGKLGCAICLIGSVVIVLHAPPDKEVQTIDEILNYAVQPGESRDIKELALNAAIDLGQASFST
jgi:hypothetical protein